MNRVLLVIFLYFVAFVTGEIVPLGSFVCTNGTIVNCTDANLAFQVDVDNFFYFRVLFTTNFTQSDLEFNQTGRQGGVNRTFHWQLRILPDADQIAIPTTNQLRQIPDVVVNAPTGTKVVNVQITFPPISWNSSQTVGYILSTDLPRTIDMLNQVFFGGQQVALFLPPPPTSSTTQDISEPQPNISSTAVPPTTPDIATSAKTVPDNPIPYNLIFMIGIPIVSVIFLLIVILLIVTIIRRSRKFRGEIATLPLHSIPASINENRETGSILLNSEKIQIKGKIGEGNFGNVFLGIWNQQPVALKTMNEKYEKLIEEGLLLQKLNHINVVRFFGIYEISLENSRQIFIVLEYLPLGSLSDLMNLNREKISELDLFFMTSDVAEGMKYLENVGVIHRDLACRNLLVTEATRGSEGKYLIKISDFGMGKILFDENYYTAENSKEIPIKWSAPEVFEFRKYSHKSDAWSFGVVLWEIWTLGKIPYSEFTNSEVIQKVKSGYRLESPEKFPENFEKLMRKCWEQNPDLRPTFQEISEVVNNQVEEFLMKFRAEEIEQGKKTLRDFKNIVPKKRENFYLSPELSMTNSSQQNSIYERSDV